MAKIWNDKKKLEFMRKKKLGLYSLYGDSKRRKAVAEFMNKRKIGWWVICFGTNMKNDTAHRMIGIEDERKGTLKLIKGELHGLSYCFVHPHKEPILLTNALDNKPLAFFKDVGKIEVFYPRQDLIAKLTDFLKQAKDAKSIAIEHSHESKLSTYARVDSGTYTLLLKLARKVYGTSEPEEAIASSGSIVQIVLSVLTEEQIESHLKAAELLCKIEKETFKLIRDKINTDKVLTENDVANFIRTRYKHYNLVPYDPPPWDALVALNPGNKHPHYAPDPKVEKIDPEKNNQFKKGSLVFIDVTARLKDDPTNVYADTTWVGYVGKKDEIPSELEEVFEVVSRARDLAELHINKKFSEDEWVRGFEADHLVRNYLDTQLPMFKDFGHCIHEVGHSIDTKGHGSGAGLSGYKYEDDRELVPGLLFSVEPGYYFDVADLKGKKDPYKFGSFGIRSEIDVLIISKNGESKAVTTTCKQKKILPIMEDEYEEIFEAPDIY